LLSERLAFRDSQTRFSSWTAITGHLHLPWIPLRG
jgi:hypothetical protein